jgi:hypothetical protein
MKSTFVLNNYSYDKDCKIGFEYNEIDSDIIPIDTEIFVFRKLYVNNKDTNITKSFNIKLTGTVVYRTAIITEHDATMRYTIKLSDKSVSEINRCIKEMKSSK